MLCFLFGFLFCLCFRYDSNFKFLSLSFFLLICIGDAYTHAVSLALEKAYIVTLSNTQHVKEFTFTFQCLYAQLYFSQNSITKKCSSEITEAESECYLQVSHQLNSQATESAKFQYYPYKTQWNFYFKPLAVIFIINIEFLYKC